jgi:hypothetical protein
MDHIFTIKEDVQATEMEQKNIPPLTKNSESTERQSEQPADEKEKQQEDKKRWTSFDLFPSLNCKTRVNDNKRSRSRHQYTACYSHGPDP